jgi:hypothetical protein
MLRWLISKGVNVSESWNGYHCLQIAIMGLHKDVVLVLLGEGVIADQDKALTRFLPPKGNTSRHERTPAVLLAQQCKGAEDIHRLLLQHGATPIDPADTDDAPMFDNGYYPTKLCWR